MSEMNSWGGPATTADPTFVASQETLRTATQEHAPTELGKSVFPEKSAFPGFEPTDGLKKAHASHQVKYRIFNMALSSDRQEYEKIQSAVLTDRQKLASFQVEGTLPPTGTYHVILDEDATWTKEGDRLVSLKYDILTVTHRSGAKP